MSTASSAKKTLIVGDKQNKSHSNSFALIRKKIIRADFWGFVFLKEIFKFASRPTFLKVLDTYHWK